MWKLKTDANGNVVLSDGKPVWINPEGAEVVYDPAQTSATIARLNTEAKTHRQEKEKAQEQLKAFEGIDATEARTALELAANHKGGKLIEQGKLEELKAELNKTWQSKLDEATKRGDTLEAQMRTQMIGGNFSRSKYLADNLTLPADIAEATFGKHFKVEDGKVRAYDSAGNAIYSQSKPGEFADFDEALEAIVNGYSHKTSILKATQRGGSGAQGGDHKTTGNTKTREQLEQLQPAERSKFFAGGGQLVD